MSRSDLIQGAAEDEKNAPKNEGSPFRGKGKTTKLRDATRASHA